MIHLGDITKIHGDQIPVVDVITGGSPCQDLSVAGKRAGLDGERSGLFMEQIRIVKEMRDADRATGRTGYLVRPRYMVWENVPGAFSSNKGKDFQAVLTEIVRITDPDAPDIPMSKKRWPKSGCLYDEMGGWSIAWRVHDAQFWGVPQRRKRIALVADFGGLSAPEVLFERKGLSRDIEQGEEARERTPGGAMESADVPVPIDASYYKGCGERNGVERQVVRQRTAPTGVEPEQRDSATGSIDSTPSLDGNGGRLRADGDRAIPFQEGGRRAQEPIMIEMTSTKNTIVEDGTSPTLTARMGTGGNQVNAVYRKEIL